MANLKSCANWTAEALLSSPIGNYKITYCEHGLHSLHLEKAASDNQPLTVNAETRIELIGDMPHAASDDLDGKQKVSDDVCTATIRWLDCYFHQPQLLSTVSQPPLCLNCDEMSFRGKCLSSLGKIAPFGGRVTYTDLASAAGNATACRAAGSAMHNNPVALIIPCHRVITKAGFMGNYASGGQVKRFLLDHEAKHMV